MVPVLPCTSRIPVANVNICMPLYFISSFLPAPLGSPRILGAAPPSLQTPICHWLYLASCLPHIWGRLRPLSLLLASSLAKAVIRGIVPRVLFYSQQVKSTTIHLLQVLLVRLVASPLSLLWQRLCNLAIMNSYLSHLLYSLRLYEMYCTGQKRMRDGRVD